jgi:hypothetical protein
LVDEEREVARKGMKTKADRIFIIIMIIMAWRRRVSSGEVGR